MRRLAKELTFVRWRWLLPLGLSICIPLLLGQSDISADNVARDIGSGRWDWTVFIKGSPSDLSRIRCVSYHLDPTFPSPDRLVCDSGQSDRPFALNAQAWKEFDIPIDIIFVDGRQQHLSYRLRLQTNSSTEVELRREFLQKHLVTSSHRVNDFCFDARSSHVAIALVDGSAKVLETIPAVGSEVMLERTLSPIIAIHFQQDQNVLAAFLKDGTSRRFDAATGKVAKQPLARLSTTNFTSAGFSLAGNLLGTRVPSVPDSVDIWAFPSAKHLYTVNGAKGVVWSKDDRKIASVGNDGTVRVIELPPSSQKPVQIRVRGQILDGCFTADDQGIAFATGTTNVSVFSVKDGHNISHIDFATKIDRVSFNPDGSSVIAISSNGTAYLRVLNDGQTTEIANDVKNVHSVSFSRDGRWLAILTDDRDLKWYPIRISDLQALLALLKNRAHN